jgi:hypothetical protein
LHFKIVSKIELWNLNLSIFLKVSLPLLSGNKYCIDISREPAEISDLAIDELSLNVFNALRHICQDIKYLFHILQLNLIRFIDREHKLILGLKTKWIELIRQLSLASWSSSKERTDCDRNYSKTAPGRYSELINDQNCALGSSLT